MALSNKAVPKYYGRFREAVIRGDIPICKEIEMEMHRIDELIDNPAIYYDPDPVEGWIRFCEGELTLTDGSDLYLLDSFKLWGEHKKLAEERILYFDEELMKFAMGNCIVIEDTNGNRKLSKKRYDQKIDAVAAMLDAYVAYKLNIEAFG